MCFGSSPPHPLEPPLPPAVPMSWAMSWSCLLARMARVFPWSLVKCNVISTLAALGHGRRTQDAGLSLWQDASRTYTHYYTLHTNTQQLPVNNAKQWQGGIGAGAGAGAAAGSGGEEPAGRQDHFKVRPYF